MGCASSIEKNVYQSSKQLSVATSNIKSHEKQPVSTRVTLHASIIIQKFFRRFKARLEVRRRCSWKIFQELEYSDEQDQINLYNFFNGFVSNVDTMNNNLNANTFNELLHKSHQSHIESRNLVIVEELESTVVPQTYNGPHIALPLTLSAIHELLEHFRSGQILHEKYAKMILHEATLKFMQLPNVLNVNISISKQITIVGDLHGQLEDLLTIFHKNGLPSDENSYIFNGDFVDRGKHSIEILLLLCSFFLLYPGKVYLNRGNHEDYLMNSRYGFTKEITVKYKSGAATVNEYCRNLFSWLPLATIISKQILVIHGGISEKTNLETMKTIPRNKFVSVLKPTHVSFVEENSPSLEAMMGWEQILDLLWSDPQVQAGKTFNVHRGGGCRFGPDITKTVLENHNWNLIIRSHECKFEGYDYTHNNKVLTVFSASSYYTNASNFGAYVKIDVSLVPRVVQFVALKEMNIQKLTASLIAPLHISRSLYVRVGMNEESAMKELKEKICNNKQKLMERFQELDLENIGLIDLSDWARTLETILHLELPWKLLSCKLVKMNESGKVVYKTCLDHYEINSFLKQNQLLSETIYKHKHVLETVFRIMDKDCSGLLSSDELKEACLILNKYTNGLITESRITELAKSLDINKDGLIDFNEFLEAFRLVSSDREKHQIK